MSGRDAGLVVRELGSRLKLQTAQTRYRGHARELAAASAADGYDLVVTFGGDGTVNEVVNGLMNPRVPDCSGPTLAASGLTASARPAIAPVPGGGANVFARTLGLPPDPAGAVRRILAAVEAGTSRTIGLGLAAGQAASSDGSLAKERYFTFSAGLGLDAEVVADVERRRASGGRSSTLLYMWTALRRYYTATNRRHPALTLLTAGQPPVSGLFMGVVTNSSPWTYVGSRPVGPAPHSDFMHGLDLFALRRLRTLTTLTALSQMMHANDNTPSGRDVVAATALTDVTFRADRPIAFHIDGEYLGEADLVTFRYLPDALHVIV
jgi:diacylglycerol kinase family enzyme